MCRLAFTRAVVQAIRTYAEDYNGALPPAIVLSDPAFTSHPLCESYLLPESYGNPDLCCSSKPIRLALVRPAETIDEITDPPSTIGALDILAVHANHRRIAICAFDVKPRYVTRDEFDALRRHPANHALAEVLAEPVPNTPKGQR